MMKKKLLTAVLVIIICESVAVSGILLYLLYFNGHNSKSDTDISIDAYREQKLKDTLFYDIKADIEVSKNVVILKQEIDFKKASDKLLAYVPSNNNADTKIKKIYSEKGISGFSLKDTTLEIRCNGAQSNIKIEYEITLQDNADFLKYDGNFYYLTNFLITPMVYHGSKPVKSYKSSFGDPYIYGINNYYVLFKTDKSAIIEAPGNKEEHIFGSNKITIFEADNLRDFPAVISRSANISKTEYKGINVFFINSQATKNNVIHALQFAQENIGLYPYKNLFVVKVPISQQGMEFSNMIFISDKCFSDDEELKRVTYHEVLHQWFYGIIGTDQLDEPFLDEGLVNYLSILMSNPAKLKDKPIENSFIRKPLYRYASREEYYKLAYNDASAYFYTIHQKLGNNFYKLLQKLYKEKKYKILYFSEFEDYVQKYGGK